MIACTNEYEALTLEAQEVMKDFEDYFKVYCQAHPGFAIRELEYLAHSAVHIKAAEMILVSAMNKRRKKGNK